MQRNLEAAAAAHRDLAVYHTNLSAVFSSRASALSTNIGSAWFAALEPVANHSTNKEQQTEPVEEMLLSDHALEMFRRMKDVNLTKIEEREYDLYRRLASCGSPSARERVLLGAIVEAEGDKSKRALLQDTLVLIILEERHLDDFEALDKAMLEVFADNEYDSLWRSRFHNSVAKLVGPSLWPSKTKMKKRKSKNVPDAGCI